MADPVSGIVLVGTVAAEGAKVYFQEKESDSKMAAIEMESQQRLLQHQQKTLANFDLTNRILDEQVAKVSTRGVSLSSPSLEAIQRNTINTSIKRQKNYDIEQDIGDFNESIEKQNVQDTLWAQLFGDVAETANAFTSYKSKLPSKA